MIASGKQDENDTLKCGTAFFGPSGRMAPRRRALLELRREEARRVLLYDQQQVKYEYTRVLALQSLSEAFLQLWALPNSASVVVLCPERFLSEVLFDLFDAMA